MARSRFHPYSLIFRALASISPVVVLVFFALATASAQSVETKPVARLITDSVDSPISGRAPEPGRRLVATSPATYPALKDATEIERRAFEQTNRIRMQHGLAPFVWAPELCRLARQHSENMARLRFFSHATPQGLRLQDRARAAGIRYSVIAENIAYNMGYDDPGAFAVERWMASEGHRANILYAGFQSMAVGTFVAADGSVYLTQTFITR